MSDEQRTVSVIIKAVDAVKAPLAKIREHLHVFSDQTRALLRSAFELGGIASIGEFVRKSFEEANDYQDSLDQIAGAVNNLGLSYRALSPEIEATVGRFADMAAMDQEPVRNALAQLITISGDYRGSLANLGLVLDLSVKEHKSLQESALIVGKTMAGNTRGLQELGIRATSAADGIAQLRQRYQGFAEREGNSFLGLWHRIVNALADFEQQLGETVEGNSVLRDMFRDVVRAIQGATTWLHDNGREFGYWVAIAVSSTKAVGVTLWSLVRIAFDAGQFIGFALKRLWIGIEFDILQIFNVVPVKLNEMIEQANRLPGINIKWRAPELSGTLNELAQADTAARTSAIAAGRDIGHALGSVVDAWDGVRTAAGAANEAQITALDRPGKGGGGGGAPDLTAQAFTDRISKLADLAKEASTAGEALAGLRLMEAALEAQLKATSLPLAKRLQLEKELNDVRAAAKKAAPPAAPADLSALPGSEQDQLSHGLLGTGGVSVGDIQAEGVGQITGPSLGDQFGAMFAKASGASEPLKSDLQEIQGMLTDLGTGTLGSVAEGFSAFFTAVGAGGKMTAQSLTKAMLGSISQVAKAEGDIALGKSFEAIGEGIWRHDPSAFAGAAKLAGAAAFLYVIAGAVGRGAAGGGASSGGGGGVGAAATQASSAAGGGSNTIVIQGGLLNMNDPRQRQELADAINALGATRDIQIVSG